MCETRWIARPTTTIHSLVSPQRPLLWAENKSTQIARPSHVYRISCCKVTAPLSHCSPWRINSSWRKHPWMKCANKVKVIPAYAFPSPVRVCVCVTLSTVAMYWNRRMSGWRLLFVSSYKVSHWVNAKFSCSFCHPKIVTEGVDGFRKNFLRNQDLWDKCDRL